MNAWACWSPSRSASVVRALDVDQHEHALLAHRLMVAPEQEVVEGAPTDHPAHLQEFEITRKMTNASTVSRSKGQK